MSEASQAIAAPSAQDTPLDERQRSMLEAMGIKLWLPEARAAAEAAPPTAEAPRSPRPSSLKTADPAPATALDFKKNPASAHMGSAQDAIKNRVAEATQPSSSPAAADLPTHSDIAQLDWRALQRAVSTCQACALCASRKNTVFGVGPVSADTAAVPQADWLIVGEAPGENEDIQGEPFVGQAGKLLDNMLAAMKIAMHETGSPVGLSRQRSVYIANVLKCRPPANRNPSSDEIARCEPYLARQIELLRPKIILAMGKFAISSLTGSTEPVGKMRGRVHALQHPRISAPVIVTYHPAYLLRNLPDKAKAWADLMLAMQTYRQQA